MRKRCFGVGKLKVEQEDMHEQKCDEGFEGGRSSVRLSVGIGIIFFFIQVRPGEP